MADNREYLSVAQENGAVHISEEVIGAIVAMAVLETEGVYGLGPNGDSTDKLGRKSLGRSIRLAFGEESVTVACDVTLLFGYSVIDAAKSAQEHVATAIESMTGCKVLGVDVTVSAITLPK